MLVYIIFSSLIFVLLPSIAHAWGPGTHIEIALSLLEKTALMAPAVRAIVSGREHWFMYGSIAADIIVGKKFAGDHHHCHNWTTGFKVLKAARTDREKAAAYGYLSHLAADIISHNYYIPFSIIKSYRAHTLSHTYWEMRFDMHVRPQVWDEMKKMILHDFSPFDKLLKKTLHHALFSFRTSKTIFSGILALQRFKHFRRTFAAYAKKSRFGLDSREISHYMRLALASAGGFLADPSRAPCVHFDPIGDEKIEYAHWMRWKLKRDKRKKHLTAHDIERQLAIIKQKLYRDIEGCNLSTRQRSLEV